MLPPAELPVPQVQPPVPQAPAQAPRFLLRRARPEQPPPGPPARRALPPPACQVWAFPERPFLRSPQAHSPPRRQPFARPRLAARREPPAPPPAVPTRCYLPHLAQTGRPPGLLSAEAPRVAAAGARHPRPSGSVDSAPCCPGKVPPFRRGWLEVPSPRRVVPKPREALRDTDR